MLLARAGTPVCVAEGEIQVASEEGWQTQEVRDLLTTILELPSSKEAAAFFRDLCTLGELHDMAQRWAVVRLLEEGKHYAEISRRTGASTATITRINSWRRFGTGGYRLLLDRRKARSK